MTDELDVKVKLFLLASPFFLCLTGLALDFYIAFSRDFKMIISSLPRSKCLLFAEILCGQANIKSRMATIAIVSSELMFPDGRIRRGSLDAQDYMEFPKGLKRRMVIAGWLNISGFTWLIANGLII